MIIIQPSGGLCNRMRVINSGWKLARERKEKLQILWNCNAELNCPFESLFQPVTEFKITSIHSVADPRKLSDQRIHSGTPEFRWVSGSRLCGISYRKNIYFYLGMVLSLRRLSPLRSHRAASETDRQHHFPLRFFLRRRAHPPHRQPACHRQKLHGCLYPFHEAGTGG